MQVWLSFLLFTFNTFMLRTSMQPTTTTKIYLLGETYQGTSVKHCVTEKQREALVCIYFYLYMHGVFLEGL